ncbi:flavanone 3-dioxygenase 1-like [Miscanthus floridulus]|uniref:flavanone 3-dioxygenase 1-like n=1 Tax=Miscanthus floridulus TaxID=154761 RepID=UPI0034574969
MAQASSGVPFLPTAASEDATLRASFVRDEDKRPKVPHNRFSDEVPVVSLEGIDGGASGGLRSVTAWPPPARTGASSSHLSIATFQNPAPDATVHPLAVRDGKAPILDQPITFAEMYRRKMARDIELARLKKQAKAEKQLQQHSATEFAVPNAKEFAVPNAKSVEDILA